MFPSASPRRAFLRTAVHTTAALTAASYSRVMGANDKVNLGLIGSGERGRHDMGMFQKVPIVNVTAVCDVYAAA